jgi:phage-related protein
MEQKPLKKIIWINSSLDDLKSFPKEVQQEVGFALHRVQEGFTPHQAKPLKGLSFAVMEIVSDHNRSTYRAVYTTKIGKYIYVLHSFQKKSKKGIKTPRQEIDLIKKRLGLAQEHATHLAEHN